MRWLTDVRRIVSIVFRGEDPVLRELREARRKQEQMVLHVFRTIHEELLKKEQAMIKAREEAVNKIKSVTEQVVASRPELGQEPGLTMDELYTYLQGLKQNKIPFDLNADIRAQVREFQENSGGEIVFQKDPASSDDANALDIRAHLEELSRADRVGDENQSDGSQPATAKP